MRVTRTTRDFQNALLTLLEDHSFEHLTVDQICQEAMLHRSSFYRYFRDKYDLLEQTIDTQVSRVVNNSDTEEDIIKQLIFYISDHKNVFRHLASDTSHSSLFEEMMHIITNNVLKHQRDDSNDLIFKLVHEADDPKLLANVISGGIIGCFYWWQENSYDVPVDEVVQFAEKTVLALSNGQAMLNKDSMRGDH